MAALPVEQAAVSAVSPVTGQIPSGYGKKCQNKLIVDLLKFVVI